MGLHQERRYKELKIMQDADAILADCQDLIMQHALDPDLARNVLVNSMLGDQPLPLQVQPS
jgi:heterodisulfide reductase subunit D